MNKLVFTGTGTSSGVPVVGCDCEVCRSADPRDNRLRTSAFLVTGSGERLLFDIGPDFRAQALRYGIVSIDGVLITHSHQDHIGGIDELRQHNHAMMRPADVYGNSLALEEIKSRFDYIFKETQKGGGKPRLTLHLANGAFKIGKTAVETLEVMHGKIPILGYRVGELAYITDASAIPPETMEKIKGVKILVLNALRFHPHPTHFNLKQSLEVVDTVRPERAFFIHLTHLFKHERDSKLLPPGVEFAYDGLEIEF